MANRTLVSQQLLTSAAFAKCHEIQIACLQRRDHNLERQFSNLSRLDTNTAIAACLPSNLTVSLTGGIF